MSGTSKRGFGIMGSELLNKKKKIKPSPPGLEPGIFRFVAGRRDHWATRNKTCWNRQTFFQVYSSMYNHVIKNFTQFSDLTTISLIVGLSRQIWNGGVNESYFKIRIVVLKSVQKKLAKGKILDTTGFEPMTFSLQGRRATNCAICP